MVDTTNGPLTPQPGAENTRLADTRWPGHMASWNPADATHGGFAFLTSGLKRLIYTPLATTSLAGAMPPAHFNKVNNWPIQRLDYNLATDVTPGAAAAGVWTDITANQNFTVNSATSHQAVAVRCGVLFTSATLCQATTRLLFDAAGTPVPVDLGVDLCPAGGFGMVGGGAVLIAGVFAAGTHTVKLQVAGSQNVTFSCHASTQPNYEFCNIHILELTP